MSDAIERESAATVEMLMMFGMTKQAADTAVHKLIVAVREEVAEEIETQPRLPYAMQRYVRLEDARIARGERVDEIDVPIVHGEPKFGTRPVLPGE